MERLLKEKPGNRSEDLPDAPPGVEIVPEYNSLMVLNVKMSIGSAILAFGQVAL